MGKNQPLVSVIIPCYNQAHFLNEAIESVLNQTFTYFEIVVVDDGSLDDTSAVAAGYKGVRCIRQRNQGLPAARNTGIRESRGDYLVFLDADDRLLPVALGTGINALTAHPDCAFVSGRCRWTSTDGIPVVTPPQPLIERDHYLRLLESNCIYGCMAAMFRRLVFEYVGGFDKSLSSCEDYDLYLRIARRFPVHCHDVVIAEYRRHAMNMSGNARLMLKSVLKVLASQKRYVRANKQFEEARRNGIRYHRELYGERVVEELRADFRSRRWMAVLKGVLALLQHYPRGLARHAGRASRRLILRVEN